MNRPSIALQLYSVREECKRDFKGTLARVAEMGYEGVEFAGFYNWSADKLKDLLDDLGLKVAGAHISIDSLLGDNFEKTVEFHRILGNKYLIVPGLPENWRNSREAWLKTAKIFNEIAERLKPYDMRVGYHNHTVEFQKFDDETGWDLFFRNTVPEVIMQLDTGNAMHGGVSADELLEMLKRYSGRAVTIHLKEYSSTDKNALIGEGEVKWLELFKLCETIGGTEWYVIEQETYKFPPLECVKRNLDTLLKLLKNV
ncbi:MAG: sugar phosphate isomerase/epimerase [Thermoprotei archaeon]|nr:MAG: xylose isomerase [Thermofilum sp. ex4484_79]RLF07671.1 MAG: sugar phosphate isomerase/epimerase [Thermoprotei archaeon]